jgi:tetratricopeptide (TPR) repeat protein
MSPGRVVLFVGLLFAFGGAHADDYAGFLASREQQRVNSVSRITVKPEVGGWKVAFVYTFTGQPNTAAFLVSLEGDAGDFKNAKAFDGSRTVLKPPVPGRYYVEEKIAYPLAQGTSRRIVVSMIASYPNGEVLSTATLNKVIEWPDPDTWSRNAARAETEHQLLMAELSIDHGAPEALQRARASLETMIRRDPQVSDAYVQLARLALGSEMTPENTHQAETLLDSALRISPDSANARILLGYIRVQQGRFPDAAQLFTQAAKSNPPNLWLWAYWGELLALEHKPDEAIAMYRKALSLQAEDGRRYYRAHEKSYVQIMPLLEAKKDFDGMDAIYKQKLQEFGPGSCFSEDYSRFLLEVRGDPQAAIDIANQALNLDCDDRGSRQTLGLASYVKWAQTKGADREAALSQARAFLPVGANAFYRLASGDRTAAALKQLLAEGEKIDQKDDGHMTALALAFQDHNHAAAARLLKLGAQPGLEVGPEGMPVALLPVISGDVEGVHVLQRAGFDYSNLRYQGDTAIQIARAIGNEEVVNALIRKGHTL